MPGLWSRGCGLRVRGHHGLLLRPRVGLKDSRPGGDPTFEKPLLTRLSFAPSFQIARDWNRLCNPS